MTETRWRETLATGRPILVTGAAGFIGFHLARRLLAEGLPVLGFDNLNAYYDPALKRARLAQLEGPGFRFIQGDLADREALAEAFAPRPAHVVHLAAQAGVRHSIENPHAYAESNLVGHLNVLEACRHGEVSHLVYASSSSVYGGNTKQPFSTADRVDQPVSLYAATKKAGELMSHTYGHLYGLGATGLRFFTVYGPWGRPDMAYYKFTKAILAGAPIQVFNHGAMARDFTYIDDIVEGVARVLALPGGAHRVFNIGNNRPERLMEMIGILEELLGQEAAKEFLPMQPGDVPETFADIADLEKAVGFRPATPLRTGLAQFVD
ncbi:MAG: NAD-dependent epimerase/dehydratase family protein, partial [Pseudomonadota bacterium]